MKGMDVKQMSSEQIRRAGLAALERELGVVGMVRFLQLFDRGSGDYSVERHEWLDRLDVQTVVDQIEKQRKKG